jgi:signal peptidase II
LPVTAFADAKAAPTCGAHVIAGVIRRVTPMSRVWRLVLVGTLLLGCVGCDQISKRMARDLLGSGASYTFVGDIFRLVYVENPGAFLGIGASLSGPTRVILFQALIGLLVAALLWAAAMRAATRPWTVVGLTLLAASGLGNLIDRLLHDGRVTDFLNLGVGSLRTGIFNVADVVGVLGVAILLLAGDKATPSNSSLERTV